MKLILIGIVLSVVLVLSSFFAGYFLSDSFNKTEFETLHIEHSILDERLNDVNRKLDNIDKKCDGIDRIEKLLNNALSNTRLADCN
jgi:predicted  nucleic acid-binding Zn-ribbon protein